MQSNNLVDVNSLIDESPHQSQSVDVNSLIEQPQKKNSSQTSSNISAPSTSPSNGQLGLLSGQRPQEYSLNKSGFKPVINMEVPKEPETQAATAKVGLTPIQDLQKQNTSRPDNTIAIPNIGVFNKQVNAFGEVTDKTITDNAPDESVVLRNEYNQKRKGILNPQVVVPQSELTPENNFGLATPSNQAASDATTISKPIKKVAGAPQNEPSPPTPEQQFKQKVDENLTQLDKETIAKTGEYAMKVTSDPVAAGFITKAVLGDNIAISQKRQIDKGYNVPQADLYNTGQVGISSFMAALDKKYADDPQNADYLKQKADLQNQSATLIDKFPEYKTSQLTKAVAVELEKLHPETPNNAAMAQLYLPEIKKEMGLSDEDVKNIDFDNYPSSNFITSAIAPIYKGALGLGAFGTRIIGDVVGADKDFLNSKITQMQQSPTFFDDTEAMQNTGVTVDTNKTSPTFLQDVADPNKGKYNYNFHTISNAIGNGVGQLAWFVYGSKGIGAAANKVAGIASNAAADAVSLDGLPFKLSPEATNEVGMAGLMIGQSYEDNYQKARGAISDKPEDEWKRHAFALLQGSLDYLGFRVLGNVVRGLPPTAEKEIGQVFKDAPNLAAVNKTALQSKLTDVLKGLSEAGKETAFVGGATTLSEIAKAAVVNVLGNDKAAEEENKQLPDVIASSLMGLPFNMFLPIVGAKIIAGGQSKIQNENIYNAGINPESYKGDAHKLFDMGVINQEQLNDRIQVINTAANVVKSIPSDVFDNLNHNQRVSYVNSKIKEAALKAKAANIQDGALSEFYNSQIKNEVIKRADILNGGGKEGEYPQSVAVIKPKTQEEINNQIPDVTIAPNENVPRETTGAKVILPQTITKEQGRQIVTTTDKGNAAVNKVEQPTEDNLVNQAKDLVNSGVVKGFTEKTLKESANNNPEEFKQHLKDISEQANDPKSNRLTVDTYGKELVDIAQKLNPVEGKTEQNTSTPTEAKEPLTKEAQDLLNGLNSGSKPTFITKNLERIANENGIEITGKMSADDVISALKEKQITTTPTEVNKPISVNEARAKIKDIVDRLNNDNWVNTDTKFDDSGSFNNKKEDSYTISHSEDNKGVFLSVKDKNGATIGTADFKKDKDGIYTADEISVNDDLQGGGIGRAMYDYVDNNFGRVEKSVSQSKSGRDLWEQNEINAERKIKELSKNLSTKKLQTENKAPKEKPISKPVSEAASKIKNKYKDKVKVKGWFDTGESKDADMAGDSKRKITMPDGSTEMVKPVAPEIVNGFYSPIEKKILGVKASKLSANKWKELFGKGDEPKFTGMLDFLNSKKPNDQVSKQEVLDYIKNNRIQLVEVVKGDTYKPDGKEYNDIQEKLSDLRQNDKNYKDYLEGKIDWNGLNQSSKDLLKKEQKLREARVDVKYSDYQLPGEKENYKEVLITMPSENKDMEQVKSDFREKMHNKYGDGFRTKWNGTEQAEWNRLVAKAEKQEKEFKSSHFEEPNILAHVRMSTRTDAEGKKVLFVDEVQSDWGQKGKREGFAISKDVAQNKITAIADKLKKYGIITVHGASNHLHFEKYVHGVWKWLDEADVDVPQKEAQELIKEARDINYNAFEKPSNTPPAPFVTDTNQWAKLGLKYALRHAVEEGADKIAWTTGEQQNERYDLSKQLSRIEWKKNKDGNTYTWTAFSKENPDKVIDTDSSATLGDIEKTLGKEIAKQIKESSKPQDEIVGDKLKLGGTGMTGFYGEPSEGKVGIIGNVAKALVKELTGKEGKIIDTKIDTGEAQKSLPNFTPNEITPSDVTWQGNSYYIKGEFFGMDNSNRSKEEKVAAIVKDYNENYIEKPKPEGAFATQHSIEITPELKAAVESGMPLLDKSKIKTDNGKQSIDQYVSRAKEVASKLFPDAKFETFDTHADFEKAGGIEGSRGTAITDNEGNKTILLNLAQMKEDGVGKTAFHEVIHPIVSEVFGRTPEELVPVWNEIATTMKDVEGMDKVWEHLIWYNQHKTPVEGITEFLTQIADGNIKVDDIPKAKQSKLFDLINKLFEKLGIKFKIDSGLDLHNFATEIKKAFDTGDVEGLKKYTGKEGEQVKNADTSSDKEALVSNMVKDAMDEGLTSLNEVRDAITSGLENNSSELKKLIEDAFNKINEPTGTSESGGNDNIPPKERGVDNSGDTFSEWSRVNLESLNKIKDQFRKIGIGWDERAESAMRNLQKRSKKGERLYDTALREMDNFYKSLSKDKTPRFNTDDQVAMHFLKIATEQSMANLAEDAMSKNAFSNVESIGADILNDQFNRVSAVLGAMRSESGVGLAYGNVEARLSPDYGLKVRQMQMIRANKGEPLSDEQNNFIKDHWEKEKELNKREQEAREQALKDEFEKRISDLQSDFEKQIKALKEKKASEPNTKNQKTKLSSSLRDISKRIRETNEFDKFIKGEKGDTKAAGITFDMKEGLAQAIDYIAKAVEGTEKLSDAIKKAVDKYKGDLDADGVKDFKEKIHTLITKASLPDREYVFDKIKELAHKDSTSSITKEMVGKNLIKNFVDSHIGDFDKKDILNEATKRLQEVLPDVTKEQVTEAYLKKGEFLLPKKSRLDEDVAKEKLALKKIAKDELTANQQQKIKLQEEKQKALKRIEELKGMQERGEYNTKEPSKPVVLSKQDAELINIDRERNKLESAYRKEAAKISESKSHIVQRVADTVRSLWVAVLIGRPKTFAKIAWFMVARPTSEVLSKLSFGKAFGLVAPDLASAAKAGGESNSIRSVGKMTAAFFKNMGEKKLQKLYENGEKRYVFAKAAYEQYKNTEGHSEKKLAVLKRDMDNKMFDSLGNIMYQFIGGSSIKDAVETLVHRTNIIEKQFGKIRDENIKEGNTLDKVNYVMGFIGRSHSALKTLSGRASFAGAFMARIEAAYERGQDLGADKLLEIAHESYLDWERGKYQQSNWISDTWNRIVSSIDNGKPNKEKWKNYNKSAQLLARTEVAITRVPVNIIHEEVAEYLAGAFRAPILAAKAYNKAKAQAIEEGYAKKISVNDEIESGSAKEQFKKRVGEIVRDMDGEQAAKVMRLFRKGGMGLGLYAAALIWGGIHFGIFPHKGQKKVKKEEDLAPDELNPGQIMFGNDKLGDVTSAMISHTPALWDTFMGLGLAKSYYDDVNNGRTTTDAAARALTLHLKIIESNIPQAQIISPTETVQKVGAGFKKNVLDSWGLTDAKETKGGLPKNSTAYTYLDKHNIDVAVPEKFEVKVGKDKKHPFGRMTDEDYSKFKKIRSSLLKERLSEFLPNAQEAGLPRDKVQEEIKSILSSVTKIAKNQMISDGIISPINNNE